MIAAVIQSPSYYPTTAGKAALVARWHYVLNGLVAMGDLTAQQAAAEKFPTVLPRPGPARRLVSVRPVRAGPGQERIGEPRTSFSSAQIDNDGLRIVTTISKHDDGPAVRRGEHEREADGRGRRRAAVVRLGRGGGAGSADRGDHRLLRRRRRERVGQGVPQTCENNTVLSREQVGSSFKPYVLATAVQQGMNVQTTQLDGYSPLWIPPDSEPTTPAARSADQAVASSAKITTTPTRTSAR